MATANPILKSQSGSTAVESAVALTVLGIALTGGLALAYLSFARVWIERCSYEAMICLSTSALESQCERKLRSDISAALPIGEIATLMLSRDASEARVFIRFENEKKELLSHRAKLALPLRAGATP